MLDPKAGVLEPNAGVLGVPNKLPPELFEPNKLLLELAPENPGPLVAPKEPDKQNWSDYELRQSAGRSKL